MTIKKNDDFSFSVKLICLDHVEFMVANVVVIDNVFSFKNSNTVITNYGFEFDSIIVVLYNDI